MVLLGGKGLSSFVGIECSILPRSPACFCDISEIFRKKALYFPRKVDILNLRGIAYKVDLFDLPCANIRMSKAE